MSRACKHIFLKKKNKKKQQQNKTKPMRNKNNKRKIKQGNDLNSINALTQLKYPCKYAAYFS